MCKLYVKIEKFYASCTEQKSKLVGNRKGGLRGRWKGEGEGRERKRVNKRTTREKAGKLAVEKLDFEWKNGGASGGGFAKKKPFKGAVHQT